MLCGSYLSYFPLCSILCRSRRSRTGQKNIYRIFASFATNSCFSFLFTGLPIAATFDTSTVAKPPSAVSNVSFQLGDYTDDILDELGVDDMRLFMAKTRNTLSPDLPSTYQPSNLFSTPTHASDTTPTTSSTPKIDRVRYVTSVSAMQMFRRSLDF